jgi:ATP-dependent exoDNAse (exonuclease V) beta subunit
LFTIQEINESGLKLALLPPQYETFKKLTTTVPSGWVARSIGHAMSNIGTQVLYYGHAHADKIPLATVRRESTNFFHPAAEQQQGSTPFHPGQATVGAPPSFAENYNIRLTSQCTKSQARSLTKFTRERDGGLAGVEALTLAYSRDRWEVACNLLTPAISSASDIQKRVDLWQQRQQEQQQHQQGGRTDLVEVGYRVGTTVEQCLEALDQTAKNRSEEHNQQVRERLQRYLSSGFI